MTAATPQEPSRLSLVPPLVPDAALFDVEQAHRHRELIGIPEGQVHLRALHWNGPAARPPLLPGTYSPESLELLQQDGYRLYLIAGGGQSDPEVKSIPAMFAEWDDLLLEDVLALLHQAQVNGLPEHTLLLTTWQFGSPHVWWRLQEPCTDIERWKRLMGRLVLALGSDPSCTNPSRLMRLAGSSYIAKAGHPKEGEVLGQAEILHEDPDATTTIEELEAWVAEQFRLRPDLVELEKAVAVLRRRDDGEFQPPTDAERLEEENQRTGKRRKTLLPPRSMEEIQTALAQLPHRESEHPDTDLRHYHHQRMILLGLRDALYRLEVGEKDERIAGANKKALEIATGRGWTAKAAAQVLESSWWLPEGVFWGRAKSAGWESATGNGRGRGNRSGNAAAGRTGNSGPEGPVRGDNGAEDEGAATKNGNAQDQLAGLAAVLHAIGDGWQPDEKVGRKRTRLQPGDLLENLIRTLGPRLEFDLMAVLPTIDREPFCGDDLELLYVELSRNGWAITKEHVIDGLVAAGRRNSFHPVRDYLARITADPAIEPIDLASFGETYFSVADPLQQRFLKIMLLGAVWRAMEPGQDFKTCVVLYGAQTLFKSLSLRALAGADWFCDTHQESDKDQRMALHRSWIVELAELEAITAKKDVSALKAMLSSTIDTFRLPYARTMLTMRRASIFVGTTNRMEFLLDETGNDRFLVVHIAQELDHERIAADRDRIWKAAMLGYQNGERPWLSRVERAASEAQNQHHITQDPWLPMLERWTASRHSEFSTDEALIGGGCRMEGQITTANARQASNVLRSLGFTQTKHQHYRQGKKARLWRRGSDGSDAITPSEPHLSRSEPSPAQASPPLAQMAQIQESTYGKRTGEGGWGGGPAPPYGGEGAKKAKSSEPLSQSAQIPVLPVDLGGSDASEASEPPPSSEPTLPPAPTAVAEPDIPYESPERLADIREERIPPQVRELRDADRLWEQQHLGRAPEPDSFGPAEGPSTPPWFQRAQQLATDGLIPAQIANRLFVDGFGNVSGRDVKRALEMAESAP